MLTQGEFVAKYAGIGASKASAKTGKLLLLSVLSGFFIALGGVVTNTASFAVTNPSLAKLLCGVLFPGALIMVIYTGAELFTGNCLITISVLEKRTGIGGMLRNLAIVYIGNFVGSLLTAASIVSSDQISMGGGALAVTTMSIAASKCSLSFGAALIKGICCNILVCAAVMAAISAKDAVSKAICSFVPVSFFVISGFEHSIANMYYVPAGLIAAAVPKYAEMAASAGVSMDVLNWGSFITANLIPVTLGNIIGGCGFAAVIWYCHRVKEESK